MHNQFKIQTEHMRQYVVGIRREDKSVWEQRVPLTPVHVAELIKENPDIKFIVQPSKKRIFSDWEYQQVGAILSEDLNQAELIIGVKEIPLQKFIPEKTFMFFSHTIKAQSHNMSALDLMLKNNIRLIDYEKITDEKNNRLIAFGRYAGIAGALDFLKGIGEYIMQMGISTPLLSCNCAYKYFDIQDAYYQMKKIGEKIKQKQIPKQLLPMIFAITGRGRTAQGCLQVLKNLPITEIDPHEVQALCENKEDPKHRKTIYVVNINTEDVIVHRDPEMKFDKQDYYKNPQKYKSDFKTKYLPYISALFHCIYWDVGCPVYIKNKHLKQIADKKALRLLGICDVTCDIDGSIECLKNYTQPEKPFFYYNAKNQQETFDSNYEESKFLYLAVDFLPCQLATDASMHFSRLLKEWIPNLVKSDRTADIEDQKLLPQLKRAVITSNGKLTPNFQYIQELREKSEMQEKTVVKKTVEKKAEVGATASVLHNNVAIIKPKDIKPKTLDFSDDQ